MLTKEAPYATLHDLPKYQEREKAASAPWEKDQRTPAAQSTRMESHYFSSSQTAPFATSDNQPILRQRSTVNESSTSGQTERVQENRHKAMAAPWDRDESHYSSKIRQPGVRTSPFATDLSQK